MRKGMIAMAVASLFCVGAAQAEESWTGNFELGFSNSTGNTRDSALHLGFDLQRKQGLWRHDLLGEAHRARADGDSTAEYYELGYKPRRYLSDYDYVFGTLRYERDMFSDIRHRWTQIGGYGRQLIDTETTELEVEIGAGARQTRYDVNPDNLDRSEGILYTGGRFEHALSETASFVQTLRVDFGNDNTFVRSQTGLRMDVTNSIAAKLQHTIRHNTDIRGDRGKRTDQFTSVNMVYNF